jgi:hypothetical protein
MISSLQKDVHKFYANTVPYYVRTQESTDFGIHGNPSTNFPQILREIFRGFFKSAVFNSFALIF